MVQGNGKPRGVTGESEKEPLPGQRGFVGEQRREGRH